mmetsp:Transcript_65924/g.143915  ORF Transcript_65924/g.143915 Transcript_65924/m.143915 type:complete len:212 (+) Transcript_65924:308-943(+)
MTSRALKTPASTSFSSPGGFTARSSDSTPTVPATSTPPRSSPSSLSTRSAARRIWPIHSVGNSETKCPGPPSAREYLGEALRDVWFVLASTLLRAGRRCCCAEQCGGGGAWVVVRIDRRHPLGMHAPRPGVDQVGRVSPHGGNERGDTPSLLGLSTRRCRPSHVLPTLLVPDRGAPHAHPWGDLHVLAFRGCLCAADGGETRCQHGSVVGV